MTCCFFKGVPDFKYWQRIQGAHLSGSSCETSAGEQGAHPFYELLQVRFKMPTFQELPIKLKYLADTEIKDHCCKTIMATIITTSLPEIVAANLP